MDRLFKKLLLAVKSEVFLAFVLLFIPFSSHSSPQLINKTKVLSINEQIEQMTLEQKVGQLFIFGFSETKVNKNFDRFLRKYNPGGLIAFKRNLKNPQQILNFNTDAQNVALKHSGTPLFIMIDQEGGNVTRIRTRPLPPSALALGMTENPSLSEDTGEIIGNILDLLGFNQNLAPVVDLSDPFTKNFIGNRSFGNNANKVKIMGHRFARGLIHSNVMPTIKHFPGHGGQIADSHKKTPSKSISLSQLKRKDLIPFTYFAKNDIGSAVMVAHIAFPNIDPSNLPATFSKELITEVLKKDLGFKGLIITDDIEMHGAGVFHSIGMRAVEAFKAGNDMIMVAWTKKKQRAAFNAVLNAVKTGEISKKRLHESLKKILATKKIYTKKKYEKISSKKLQRTISKNVKRLKSVTQNIFKQNLRRSLYGVDLKNFNVSPEHLIYVFSSDSKFYSSFKKGNLIAKTAFIPLSRKKKNNIQAWLAKNKTSKGIFYVTGNGTARILNQLNIKEKKRLIIVNATNPGLITNSQDYAAVINLNSRNYRSGEWVSNFLSKSQSRRPAAN